MCLIEYQIFWLILNIPYRPDETLWCVTATAYWPENRSRSVLILQYSAKLNCVWLDWACERIHGDKLNSALISRLKYTPINERKPSSVSTIFTALYQTVLLRTDWSDASLTHNLCGFLCIDSLMNAYVCSIAGLFHLARWIWAWHGRLRICVPSLSPQAADNTICNWKTQSAIVFIICIHVSHLKIAPWPRQAINNFLQRRMICFVIMSHFHPPLEVKHWRLLTKFRQGHSVKTAADDRDSVCFPLSASSSNFIKSTVCFPALPC